MLDGAMCYGIMISVIFIIFILSLCISVFRNRRGIKLYSILLREDGRISKVAVAFLFILPVILYQAIYLNQITPGLDYILLTIFGTELGVKFTDKLPDMLNKKQSPRKYYDSAIKDNYNPYKDL